MVQVHKTPFRGFVDQTKLPIIKYYHVRFMDYTRFLDFSFAPAPRLLR